MEIRDTGDPEIKQVSLVHLGRTASRIGLLTKSLIWTCGSIRERTSGSHYLVINLTVERAKVRLYGCVASPGLSHDAIVTVLACCYPCRQFGRSLTILCIFFIFKLYAITVPNVQKDKCLKL